MSLPNPLFAVLAGLIAASPVQAQQQPAPPPPNTEFKISAIDVELEQTPNFSVGSYDKKVRKPGEWLEVEATFDWQPRLADPKYLDGLTARYFVLLSNKSKDAPQGVLLSGEVNHVDVAQGKDLKSVMYVAPRALERLFDGKLPVNASQAVAGVGVELVMGGQVVAGFTTGGRGSDKERPWAWWDEPAFQKRATGILLDKSATPFAHLSADYHEPTKPKTP
jgi:hypothetical protein